MGNVDSKPTPGTRESLITPSKTQTSDFFLEVVKGDIAGHSALQKFGFNPDIDNAATYETIWNGGGEYTGFNATSAEIVTVASVGTNAADDDIAGTGARTVELRGLDATYTMQTEVVELSGTSLVDTINSYIRIDRVLVLTAGSGGENAGVIVCAQKVTTANIFTSLPIGYNQTMIAAATIPAGKTGYMVFAFASIANKKEAAIALRMKMRALGSVFQVKGELAINARGTGVILRDYKIPQGPIPEKTDIFIEASSGTDNVGIAAGFDIILVDN